MTLFLGTELTIVSPEAKALPSQNPYQITQVNTTNAIYFLNLGVAYNNLGENQRAIADYNQAISLNPNFVEADFNRGLLYRQLGETQKAIADYN